MFANNVLAFLHPDLAFGVDHKLNYGLEGQDMTLELFQGITAGHKIYEWTLYKHHF